ncbi:MAG: HlyD family secretion protein [Gammaproteobacteria bacterium]|jgi:multidrug resistance efflux pump
MSDSGTAPEESSPQKSSPNEATTPPNPMRRISLTVLGACVLLFFWYVVGDRLTPSTDQARVRGYVTPIVPQVSALVTEVNVTNNSRVSRGDVLIRLDPREFEIAVHRAKIDLEQAGQETGADVAAVAAAQGQVASARAVLESRRRDIQRVRPLADSGVIPRADADRAEGAYQDAQARLATAEANLAQAQERLGSAGAENLNVQEALVALEDAQLDLERTIITAPTDGGVTNVRIDVGRFASVGQPLMTFISTSDVWIEADMRENSLGNVTPGDPVDVLLDVAPGRIFRGEVASITFGVQTGSDTTGELAETSKASGWLRDPQRFPVIIRFSDDESTGFRREGGQADVLIYTGNNWLFNGLGWVWMRLLSYLSYIY